jgi:hypothetical protein
MLILTHSDYLFSGKLPERLWADIRIAPREGSDHPGVRITLLYGATRIEMTRKQYCTAEWQYMKQNMRATVKQDL